MILKAADGTIYKVHFRHWLPCQPTRMRGKGLCRAVSVFRPGSGYLFPQGIRTGGLSTVFMQEFVKGPKTRCYLHLGDCRLPWQLCLKNNEGRLAIGESRLKLGDTFTKKLGRWISLNRAVAELHSDGLRQQLLANYELQLLPRCQHKHKDGSPAWVAMEGFDFCPWCHLRRDKSVDL